MAKRVLTEADWKGKCKSCGLLWVDHLGIEGTCQALQTVLAVTKVTIEQLLQISKMKRCRQASVSANATLLFLQTQLMEATGRTSPGNLGHVKPLKPTTNRRKSA